MTFLPAACAHLLVVLRWDVSRAHLLVVLRWDVSRARLLVMSRARLLVASRVRWSLVSRAHSFGCVVADVIRDGAAAMPLWVYHNCLTSCACLC